MSAVLGVIYVKFGLELIAPTPLVATFVLALQDILEMELTALVSNSRIRVTCEAIDSSFSGGFIYMQTLASSNRYTQGAQKYASRRI